MNKTVLITGACINTGVAIVEKFASEGYNVIFTGRNAEKVHAKEKEYKEKFPNVKIVGYHIDSLLDERTIDEKSVEEMFADIDAKRGFFWRHDYTWIRGIPQIPSYYVMRGRDLYLMKEEPCYYVQF